MIKVDHEHGLDSEFRVFNNTNGHCNKTFGMAVELNLDIG